MMGASITQVILMAASGYWLLTRWDYTRHAVASQSGYHLFFQSILVGIFLTTPGLLLTVPLLFFIHDFQVRALTAEIFFGSGVFGFILAGLIPWIRNRLAHSEERRWVHIKKAAEERGNLLEILLETAKTRGELVELSLKSGKVYVGAVIKSGIASKEQNTDISLAPVWSGYREKDTRRLLITNDYSSVVLPLLEQRRKKMVEDETAQHEHEAPWGEDFPVVIPLEQVEIARPVSRDQAMHYEPASTCKVVTAEGVHTLQKKPVDVDRRSAAERVPAPG